MAHVHQTILEFWVGHTWKSRLHLDLPSSICCSLASVFTSVIIVIASWIPAHFCMLKIHWRRTLSVMPLLLVSPPWLLIDRIITCSITKSVHNPAQYLLFLWTVWNLWLMNISCRQGNLLVVPTLTASLTYISHSDPSWRHPSAISIYIKIVSIINKL